MLPGALTVIAEPADRALSCAWSTPSGHSRARRSAPTGHFRAHAGDSVHLSARPALQCRSAAPHPSATLVQAPREEPAAVSRAGRGRSPSRRGTTCTCEVEDVLPAGWPVGLHHASARRVRAARSICSRDRPSRCASRRPPLGLRRSKRSSAWTRGTTSGVPPRCGLMSRKASVCVVLVHDMGRDTSPRTMPAERGSRPSGSVSHGSSDVGCCPSVSS